MRRRSGWPWNYGLLWIIYVLVGFFVASNENYLDQVDTVEEFFSAVLAVFLWPLVVLGADLHLGLIQL
jgi:hypothetical protein